MDALKQYLIPYLVSQIVSVLILLAAIKNASLARVLFSLLFLYAGIYNMYIGFEKPDEYLGFAPLAVPLYREFILGWFSEHNHIVIPIIATGQLIISVLMLLQGLMVRLACVGSIIFLMAIAPLGIGSAFPFSITVSAAAYLIIRSKPLDFIWKGELFSKFKYRYSYENKNKKS